MMRIVLLTLNGLPNEYDAVKTAIRTHSKSITIEELFSLLCSGAINIEGKLKQASDLPVVYATIKEPMSSSKDFTSYSHGRGSTRNDSRGYHCGNRSTQGRSSSFRSRSQG